ncbi:MAG TPA: FliM/FliN family flagellar motor C-terminal domain-containing protein, partial [Planctomycetaceae bacterium]|nr:FliM/FliN family flagellar motor C-terminal domain-containing protein [Planctomycetaceae bacterium]
SALDPKRPGESPEPSPASHGYSTGGASARSSSSLARSAVLFCESVRKRIEAVWEPLLREPVRLKRHMPRAVALTELLDRQEPTFFGFLVESKQERADLILFIERTLVAPLLGQLLGNSGWTSDSDGLSELENRLLKRLLRECFREPLPHCRWTMASLERFDFTAERATRSGETSWWTESWELKTDSLRGKILLAGEWEFVSGSYGSGSASSAETEPRIATGSAELVVEIDSFPLDVETIRRLQPGDTIPAGETTEREVCVLVEGETRWIGRPGVYEGRNAVEIVSPAKKRE